MTCNTVKPNLLSPAIKRKGPRANATVDFAVPFTGVSQETCQQKREAQVASPLPQPAALPKNPALWPQMLKTNSFIPTSVELLRLQKFLR